MRLWYNAIAEPIVYTDHEMIDAPLYYITADNVSDNFFDFSTGGDKLVHLEYAIALPEDSTADISLELKTCYGVTFGLSLLYPCDTCDYASQCRNPIYINPALIDYTLNNRIRWGASSYAGQRVRIRYKRVITV